MQHEPGICDKFATHFVSKVEKVKSSVAAYVKQITTPPVNTTKAPTSSLDIFSPATR